MATSDAELRSMVQGLVLKALEIGNALPDDAPSDLGDVMAASFLAGLDADQRSHMRILFGELRESTDRGFRVIDRALRRPKLRVAK